MLSLKKSNTMLLQSHKYYQFMYALLLSVQSSKQHEDWSVLELIAGSSYDTNFL